LDDVVAGPRIDCVENALYVMRIDEEMLAEAAPRNMPATIELGLRHRGGSFARGVNGTSIITFTSLNLAGALREYRTAATAEIVAAVIAEHARYDVIVLEDQSGRRAIYDSW